MIEFSQVQPELIGALVAYTGGFEVEYGLVQSYSEDLELIFVRFSLGDTAAGCTRDQLDLVVPAVRAQDRDDLAAIRARLAEVVELVNKYAYYDGAHHKDWVFGKIMETLSQEHRFEGIAP
jgi:hypothetical protein